MRGCCLVLQSQESKGSKAHLSEHSKVLSAQGVLINISAGGRCCGTAVSSSGRYRPGGNARRHRPSPYNIARRFPTSIVTHLLTHSFTLSLCLLHREVIHTLHLPLIAALRCADADLGGDSSGTAASNSPIVLSEPMAGYVLIATRYYLRLYPIARVIAGERTTSKRVTLQGALQFASTFAASGAPALVCLVEQDGEVHMQVGGAVTADGMLHSADISFLVAVAARLQHRSALACSSGVCSDCVQGSMRFACLGLACKAALLFIRACAH